jgi:hypothetical protein
LNIVSKIRKIVLKLFSEGLRNFGKYLDWNCFSSQNKINYLFLFIIRGRNIVEVKQEVFAFFLFLNL